MKMKHALFTALAAGMLASMAPAQAAQQNWDFSGSFDFGQYIGESYSGSLSFDDAGVTGTGDEWASLDVFTITLLGQTYTLADAVAPAEAVYYDGQFLGVSYSVESGEPWFSLIAGYGDRSEAYTAYSSSVGLSGFGSLQFVQAPVPEPETYAMLLAGLGLLAGVARRRLSAGHNA